MTISLRQYYYFAIWLPVILPLGFFILYSVYNIKEISSHLISDWVMLGIFQYVPFALWGILKHRELVTAELKKFSLVAPLFFIPFYIVGFVLIHIITNSSIPSFYVFLMALSLSLLCIPVGYCYVLLSSIIEIILKKTGFIRDESM